MNLSLPQVIAGGVGALLIYAAIKNQNPLDVLKNGLKGQATTSGTTDRNVGTGATVAPSDRGDIYANLQSEGSSFGKLPITGGVGTVFKKASV